MRYLCFSLLMMLLSSSAFAGFGNKLPVRWGKVSLNEFSVVPLRGDAEAPAIVLCDYGDIDISNRTYYTRHIRIKILNDAGLKYASVEIPYETRDRHDDFISLQAQTLILQDDQVITSKVAPGQIEDIPINDKWNKKKFTFPEAKPGVIIEYRYTVASLDFEKLDNWYFQREIPTIWSELRFQIPQPFLFLVTFENNRELLADEELAYVDRLQWMYSTKARKRNMELSRNKNLLYATRENRYKVWAASNMKKKIIMRNLPGLSEGINGQPARDFYPQVHFDLFESAGNLPRTYRPLLLTTHNDYKSRSQWELMHDPMALNGYVQFRLNTWSEFNQELLKDDRFGMYLTKNYSNTRMMDSITRGCKNRQERLEAVYDFIRQNFKWNGEFSMFAGQDFKDFIKNRTGSSAELNLMLANLLQSAGVAADPLLIRTSDRGLPEKMFPVKEQFNHVIVVATIDDEHILLDMTSATNETNKLHKLDIGTQGWIVREDDPGWIDIFAPSEQKDSESPAFRL